MSQITPRYVTCPRCRSRVLEARWDFQMNTLIGTPLLQPVSLTPDQIVACIITSIPLWQVHEHAGKPITSRRTPWWPRGPIAGDIAPEHACGRTWDAPALDLAPDEIVYPDQPPF
jgi:hypothetical protein